jgi:hypothetical protein
MQNEQQSRPLAIGLTLLSALGRLVPHAPNVTPVGGACLFAGSKISGLFAYLLPLVAMLATDPFVGGYSASSPVIYGSLMINVWLGRRLLGERVSPVRLGAVAFLCSLQFFVLTNFATWLLAAVNGVRMYPATAAGLFTCYTEALPFWGRTLAGDLFFSAAIFGIYELLARRTRTARTATA